ncbi:hypothetical protein TNCV_1120451 [Trichonephila clavipes]|uniref:Uncharacterized protein n=1 Tax=Trichonephila clavipes TaxID=2585209 RepID=A0A8X6T5P7_TRICX|nr:hypothetical protein TNCV_1120451 [Trichonephila clavipes]
MWSMVAQRLTQITPPAATPDQLWQRVEAAWSAVPQVSLNQCRGVWQRERYFEFLRIFFSLPPVPTLFLMVSDEDCRESDLLISSWLDELLH